MVLRRLPAVKVRIKEIINGKFFRGSKEDFRPSYIITSFGEKISRVNIIATVVDKFISLNDDYAALTLDDGSASIRAKVFKDKTNLVSEIDKGDLVLVIGKIKEFNEELYVNVEIIKKIHFDQELFRKIELLQKIYPQKLIVEEIRKLSDQIGEEEILKYAKEKYNLEEECVRYMIQSKNLEIDYKTKVLEIIRDLDKGNGVEVSKLFEILNLPENIIEKTVDELLSSGELFEPLPGRLRRVL